MQIVLKQGESITVTLADTDGEITVTYGTSVLSVHCDMPDSDGREGIIYEERFGEAFKMMQNGIVVVKDNE